MDQRQTTPPRGADAGDPPGEDPWNGDRWDWSEQYVPPQPRRPGPPDLSALFALVDALRRLVPPELQEQWGALQRELLLTARALIDWYLERLEAGARVPEVEDIPID